MLKRPHYITFVIVLLAGLVLVNLSGPTGTRLKLWLSAVFYPLVGVTESASKGLEAAGARALPKEVLISENERLRKENDQLKLQIIQTQEIWRENNKLRDALVWQRSMPAQMKLARVIYRDPANWWRSATIDLGSKAGVVTNLPVVTAQGLVGRVEAVTQNQSRIVFLGDPACGVSAAVENEARSSGTISPADISVLDESIVELTHLPKSSAIAAGQRVVTSGLGGVFPKGLPIGTILSTNLASFGLYLEAQVKLAVDVRELEYVWVWFK